MASVVGKAVSVVGGGDDVDTVVVIVTV
ncbi:unnamed protein product, partial [Rotaria magnacalcarata]